MEKYRRPLRLTLAALFCAIPLFLLALRLNLPLHMATWGHSYLTVLYSLTLLMILDGLARQGTPVLRRPWLTRLGAVSYTVYLFHPLFLSSVFLLAGRSERISSLQDIALAGAALCLTMAWASASLKFLERPLTQKGRSFEY